MKNTNLFIRLIAITIIIIALFSILIDFMVILKWIFPQFFGFSKAVNKLSIAFILEFLFYIGLLISGIGILRYKIWGLNLLIALLAGNLLYGFIPGIYQDIFSRLTGSYYTTKGKFYIILYLFFRKFLVPVILIILFTLPNIRKSFDRS